MVIDDYAYVGVDFRGDVDMIFLDGEDFDYDLGKFSEYIPFFVILKYLMFLGF